MLEVWLLIPARHGVTEYSLDTHPFEDKLMQQSNLWRVLLRFLSGWL